VVVDSIRIINGDRLSPIEEVKREDSEESDWESLPPDVRVCAESQPTEGGILLAKANFTP